MKIYIHHNQTKTAIKVKPSNTVATAKAAYIAASDLSEQDRGFVSFFFDGEKLEDGACLHELGITEGASVFHLPVRQRTYSDQDYSKLAKYYEKKQLSKRGGHGDPADFPRDWNSAWLRGDEWKSFPPVFTNIWSEADDDDSKGDDSPTAAAGAGSGSGAGAPPVTAVARTVPAERLKLSRRAPDIKFSPRSPGVASSKRDLQSQYVCKIGLHEFRMIHRLEGRWNGEARSLPPSSTDPRISAVDFAFRERSGGWRERQTITKKEGTSSATELTWRPVANGVAMGVAEGSSLNDITFKFEEQSTNIAVITAVSMVTGITLLVETVTMMSDMRRVRTVQRFTDDGELGSVLVLNEERVLDSVSGAVEKA